MRCNPGINFFRAVTHVARDVLHLLLLQSAPDQKYPSADVKRLFFSDSTIVTELFNTEDQFAFI